MVASTLAVVLPEGENNSPLSPPSIVLHIRAIRFTSRDFDYCVASALSRSMIFNKLINSCVYVLSSSCVAH